MAINFKETRDVTPWEKFSEEGMETEGRGEIHEATLKTVAKAYHEWLERMNVVVGSCLVCERKIKPGIAGE